MTTIKQTIEKHERLAQEARERKSYRVNLIQVYLENLKKEMRNGK